MTAPMMLMLLITTGPLAWAGGAGAPPASPEAGPAPVAESPPPEPLPSLDELLGLADGEAGAENRGLDAELGGLDAGEQFEQAVRVMDEAAAALRESAGLTTQRLQEDALRKLDAVIAAAQKQESGSSGSSSSSSSSSSQRQAGAPQSSQAGGAPSQAGTGDRATMPPGLDGVELRDRLLPDASAWGALPERVRDALRQGLSDRFSTLYQRMTERYYQRLAEEGERP